MPGGEGGGEGNQLAVINQILNAQLLQSVSTGLKVAMFGTVPVVLYHPCMRPTTLIIPGHQTCSDMLFMLWARCRHN